MKSVLWGVLAVAIAANALVGIVVPDGFSHLLAKVGTGGVGVVVLVGLVTVHRRERPGC